jgi:hypothetical protein
MVKATTKTEKGTAFSPVSLSLSDGLAACVDHLSSSFSRSIIKPVAVQPLASKSIL